MIPKIANGSWKCSETRAWLDGTVVIRARTIKASRGLVITENVKFLIISSRPIDAAASWSEKKENCITKI